jgi:hypothetical protein
MCGVVAYQERVWAEGLPVAIEMCNGGGVKCPCCCVALVALNSNRTYTFSHSNIVCRKQSQTCGEEEQKKGKATPKDCRARRTLPWRTRAQEI